MPWPYSARHWNPLPQPDDAFALAEAHAEYESWRVRVANILDEALAVLQREQTKIPKPIYMTWDDMVPPFCWSR